MRCDADQESEIRRARWTSSLESRCPYYSVYSVVHFGGVVLAIRSNINIDKVHPYVVLQDAKLIIIRLRAFWRCKISSVLRVYVHIHHRPESSSSFFLASRLGRLHASSGGLPPPAAYVSDANLHALACINCRILFLSRQELQGRGESGNENCGCQSNHDVDLGKRRQ